MQNQIVEGRVDVNGDCGGAVDFYMRMLPGKCLLAICRKKVGKAR